MNYRKKVIGMTKVSDTTDSGHPMATCVRTRFDDKSLAMKKIIVPLDFSKASENAMLYAAALAKHISATLELVHVIGIDSANAKLMNWKNLETRMTAAANVEGEKFLAKLNGPANTTFKVISGYPFQDVVEEHALEAKANLIVMGSSGASGIKKIFGSNAAALISHSSIPVVVVPGDYTFNGLNHLLYASDLSRLDQEVKHVADFARPFDANISVLHVVKEEQPYRDRTKLNEVLARVANYDKVEFHETNNPDVVTGIEEFAKHGKTDMVALFTHELGFYEKVFGTSVTRHVAHHNMLPLLVFNRKH